MTVYVDDAMIPFRNMLMSHMTADTVEELHAMADAIGLKRAWAQLPPEHSIPHYDVSVGKRLMAIRAGAVEEDWRDSAAVDRHKAQRRRARKPKLIVKRKARP